MMLKNSKNCASAKSRLWDKMKNKNNFFLICFLMIIFIIGCNQNPNMKLTSSAFNDHGPIPTEFTCDGANINPPLSTSNVPENAKSLALIMDDPDAVVGVFVHWVMWNIAPETREITKGNEPDGIKGKGSSNKLNYVGPCPPTGTHRYFFKLYALDTKLNLPEGSAKIELENAMNSHVIEQTSLMGTYKRNK